MLVSVLASGSEGNSCYVETNDLKILIDIGMNSKYLCDRLKELGIDSKDIDLVILTHTHKDHISALEVFLKKNNPAVWITKGMYDEIKDMFHDYEKVILDETELVNGATKILSFKTSHDAIDSRGFIINDDTSSMVYMTDTGYLNYKYFDILYDKTLYVMESNHDVEMLINGPYPKWLKTRILSDKGHLSNNAAGFYLSKLIGPNTQKVILAHLSHQNNTPEIAIDTVLKTLKEHDIQFNNISVAKQRTTAIGVKI